MSTSVQEAVNSAASIFVEVKTNMGSFKVELYRDKAPITVENFLRYVYNGHYRGTIFHRIDRDRFIHGGSRTPDGVRKDTLDPIKSEADNELKNTRGTLAMGLTDKVDTATSSFFINVYHNSNYDYDRLNPHRLAYTVFGKVCPDPQYMDVINAINDVEVSGNPKFFLWPLQDVIIEDVIRINN